LRSNQPTYANGLEHLKGLNLKKLKLIRNVCSEDDVGKLKAQPPWLESMWPRGVGLQDAPGNQ
jgi:hypothetical protein